MPHREYIREVQNSEYAILFIHGICGTPRHFDPFITLVPENWTVRNILLDGHGKGVDEFSASSMKKWKEQVSLTVKELSLSHKKIVICAHSMGTLFAINEAINNPEAIKTLILLAPPLKIFMKPLAVKTSLKSVFNKIDDTDPIERSGRIACGIRHSRKLWKYIGWIPRYFELFRESAKTRKIAHLIPCPTYIYQSKNDELVSSSSLRYFKNVSKVNVLSDSYHFHYGQKGLDYLKTEISKILTQA